LQSKVSVVVAAAAAAAAVVARGLRVALDLAGRSSKKLAAVAQCCFGAAAIYLSGYSSHQEVVVAAALKGFLAALDLSGHSGHVEEAVVAAVV